MPPRRPRTSQLGAQDGPGATQEAPKMRQEPPKSSPRGVQEATHRRLGGKTRHEAAPDSLQTSNLDYFGHDLKGFWDYFGWIVGGIFKQIGSIFSQLSAGGTGGVRPPKPPLLRGAHGGGNAALRRWRYFFTIIVSAIILLASISYYQYF